MKQIWDKDIIVEIGYFVFILVVGFVIGYNWRHKTNDTNKIDIKTPIEKVVIDTLYITRDKYHSTIKYLDSIQHDTIWKVHNLDDSTTLQLFLQLVSE